MIKCLVFALSFLATQDEGLGEHIIPRLGGVFLENSRYQRLVHLNPEYIDAF